MSVIFQGLVYAGTPAGDFLTDADGALLLLPGFGDQPGPLEEIAALSHWAPIPELDPYAQALIGLLPEGFAWTREPDSTLARLLEGQAAPLSRVQGAADALVAESDPRAAVMLLPDYEGVLGLPGPCATELADTIAERRLHVWSRWTATGGATPEFMIQLAAQLGYETLITEFTGLRVDEAQADDRLIGAEALNSFIVSVAYTDGWDARADETCADEKLGWYVTQDLLECAIRRARPAHTWAGFSYSEPPPEPPPPDPPEEEMLPAGTYLTAGADHLVAGTDYLRSD